MRVWLPVEAGLRRGLACAGGSRPFQPETFVPRHTTSERCGRSVVHLCQRSHAWLLCAFAALLTGCGNAYPTWTDELRAVRYAPEVREDWAVSTPEEQDVDPVVVAKLYHDAAQLETLFGLLVIKHDQLIAEKYFHGAAIDRAHDRMSVTKSVVSALVGLALEQGCLESLDQRMVAFFPEYESMLDDPRKRDITIRQLLQMRGGYIWEGRASPYLSVLEDWHWVWHIADFPLTSDPGSAFAYSNLTAHLLGVIVARACDTTLHDFAQEHLLAKLGATIPEWYVDDDGYNMGALGMSLSARDMAKLGALYLHGGRYADEQILPAQWVDASLQRYSQDINFTGWFDSELGAFFRDLGYGYLWWSGRVAEHHFDFAWGHGGNLIILLHDLDMIIVATADPLHGRPEEQGWEFEGAVIDLVGEFIQWLPLTLSTDVTT